MQIHSEVKPGQRPPSRTPRALTTGQHLSPGVTRQHGEDVCWQGRATRSAQADVVTESILPGREARGGTGPQRSECSWGIASQNYLRYTDL